MQTWWAMRRRRLILGLGTAATALALQAVLNAQVSTPGMDTSWAEWLRQNAFGLMVFAFHMGVSWREFLDHRRQLVEHKGKIEATERRIDGLDARYVQASLISVVHAEIKSRFDRLERRLDGQG
jgi:hypothetical protein